MRPYVEGSCIKHPMSRGQMWATVGPLVWCVSWCGGRIGWCGSSVLRVRTGSGQKPSGFLAAPVGCVLWRCPTSHNLSVAGIPSALPGLASRFGMLASFPRCCDHHKTMCSTLHPPRFACLCGGGVGYRGSYSGYKVVAHCCFTRPLDWLGLLFSVGPLVPKSAHEHLRCFHLWPYQPVRLAASRGRGNSHLGAASA